MIYTSYFAKVRALEYKGIVPISIALFKPKRYHGLEYKKLAPTESILREYKYLTDDEHYTKQFEMEILKNLNAHTVVHELLQLAGDNREFALLCYEAPLSFCHRFVVTKWLVKHGYECQEFIGGKSNGETSYQ